MSVEVYPFGRGTFPRVTIVFSWSDREEGTRLKDFPRVTIGSDPHPPLPTPVLVEGSRLPVCTSTSHPVPPFTVRAQVRNQPGCRILFLFP